MLNQLAEISNLRPQRNDFVLQRNESGAGRGGGFSLRLWLRLWRRSRVRSRILLRGISTANKK